jgi:putative oxidoreductase
MSFSLKSVYEQPNFGLLMLRVGIGSVMVLHGLPKFLGGAEVLTNVGQAMSVYGLNTMPLLWGSLVASSEVVGGLFILTGFLFRPAALMIAFTMLTAVILKLPDMPSLSNFKEFAYPLSLFFVFSSLFFIGAGSFAMGSSSKGGAKSEKKPAADKKKK